MGKTGAGNTISTTRGDADKALIRAADRGEHLCSFVFPGSPQQEEARCQVAVDLVCLQQGEPAAAASWSRC